MSLGIKPDEFVSVITPRSIVNVLMQGYCPQVHTTITSDAAKLLEPSEKQAPSISVARVLTPSFSPQMKASAALPSTESPATARQLYKLSKTPAGKELFTYFAAVLRMTGMDKGAVYPLQKFLGNFSGHIKAGRVERVDGGYRLTRSGMDYFADRYRPGSRQHVDESEVQRMAQQMAKGGDDWVLLE